MLGLQEYPHKKSKEISEELGLSYSSIEYLKDLFYDKKEVLNTILNDESGLNQILDDSVQCKTFRNNFKSVEDSIRHYAENSTFTKSLWKTDDGKTIVIGTPGENGEVTAPYFVKEVVDGQEDIKRFINDSSAISLLCLQKKQTIIDKVHAMINQFIPELKLSSDSIKTANMFMSSYKKIDINPK